MLWERPVATRPAIWGRPRSIGLEIIAGTRAAIQPTAITQPRTEMGPIIRIEREDAGACITQRKERGPIIRIEREDASVAIAQDRAAPRPPRIATMERGV